MILVNKTRALLTVAGIVTIVCVAGCAKIDAESQSEKSNLASYACKGQCDSGRFKMFSGRAVHLEIEPMGEMTQVFYNIEAKSLSTTPVVLKNVIEISGHAQGADSLLSLEATNSRHDNLVSFFDIVAIPSINNIDFLSPRVQTKKSLLTKSGYHINLLSNLAYTLILNPSGAIDRAPILLTPGLITTDQKLDFLVDKKRTLISGRVIADGYNIFLNTPSPFMRARVMQGSRLISSVATVDSDGRFSLEIANPLFAEENNQPINLIIEPISSDSPLPSVKEKLALHQLKKDVDLGTISLGNLNPPISVTVEVHGSDDSTIGNALLYLNAKIGTGEMLIKRQLDTSGTTKFTELYEGNYDIAIVPPFTSTFAMRVVKNIDLDSQENIQISIDLQKRQSLNAIVLKPMNLPVSGAQIELSRIGETGNLATEDIYDDMLFKLTAITNDDGHVCHRKFGFSTSNKDECDSLLLDEGRYLAHITPPAGTELAHKWITFDFPEQNQLAIVLDHPEMLVGQVLSPDYQTPISHAFVTVYLAEMNTHNQPKMIGNAITDERGFFKALVSGQ